MLGVGGSNLQVLKNPPRASHKGHPKVNHVASKGEGDEKEGDNKEEAKSSTMLLLS